jgi:uncharacterized protein YuzE
MTTKLELTFRNGRRFAAYLRLDGPQAQAARTTKVTETLLVDFDDGGRALGLEILAFDEDTVARINDVLRSVGHPALSDEELGPRGAA